MKRFRFAHSRIGEISDNRVGVALYRTSGKLVSWSRLTSSTTIF